MRQCDATRRWRRPHLETLEDRSLLAALPAAGLVSWWRAEGSAADFSGLNPGTLQGGAAFTTGFVGQALTFDGVDDYVDVPDSTSLDAITSGITVEAWIKPALPTGEGRFFARRDPFVREGFSVAVESNGALRVNIRTVSAGATGATYDSPSGLIHFDQFQHVAATYDGASGALKAFIDGQEVPLSQSAGPLSGPLGTNDHLFIGRRQDSNTSEGLAGSFYYKGAIDELSLYNRPLSAAEVQSIFQAGTDGKATIVVTTSADSSDANDGMISLREAITIANATPAQDVIGFNIPGAGVHTITPSTQLPAITSPVIIDGYTQPGASANTILDADNAALLVEINGTTLGTNGDGLTIAAGGSGSKLRGLIIDGGWSRGVLVQATSTVIEGCFLGTDPSGLVAHGNTSGVNFQFGIDTSNSRVGGTLPAQRNVISGNQIGVIVQGGSNHVIQGNFIGTDITGTRLLGNLGDGIVVQFSSDNTISGNTIAGNAGRGVSVVNGASGVSVLGNSIFSNGGLGIDLQGASENSFGVTANDAGDSDTGPNDLQNYPVLSRVTSSAAAVTIAGTLNSGVTLPYRLDFFANDAADASGFGEGKFFIGASSVVTNAAGDAIFSVTLPGDWRGKLITATATDLATGETSEFAQNLAAETLPVIWDGNTDGDGDGTTWQDPHNWSTEHVPDSSDRAEIPLSAQNIVLNADAVVGSLVIGGAGTAPLDLSSFTLTVGQGVSIRNGGTVVLESGTLVGAVSIDAGGQLLNLSGPQGTVRGDVVNSGVLSPVGGVLRIEGDYTQNPAGTLELAIDGPNRGGESAGYDAVDVTGAASLNGTLRVAASSSFRPAVGDRLDVLSFAAVNGDFTAVDEPLLASDRHFAESKTATSVSLVVAPTATQTVTWDGAADGDGDGTTWQDPHNWNTDRVPGLGDRAEIPASASSISLAANAAVGALAVGGSGTAPLDLSAFTLSVAQGTTIRNQGTLVLESGTLSSELSIEAGGRAINLSGALGTLHGDVINSGLLAPVGGALRIEGTYFQNPTGTLEVAIEGTHRGAETGGFDALDVTGTAHLGGMLRVAQSDVFTPSPGQRFDVLGFAAATGDFSVFEGLRYPNQLQLHPRGEATAYALTAEVNKAPIANPDSATTARDVASPPINVLANDVDLELLPGETLVLESFAPAAQGTVTLFAPGQLVYTPVGGFVGTDSFTYVVRDGGGLLSVGVVTISVTGTSGSVAAAAVATINNGLAAFGGRDGLLADWGSLFDLNTWTPDFAGFQLSPFDLSIVTQSLSTAFGLGGSAGSLGQLVLPTISSTAAADGLVDTLSELVSALGNIPGLHIDTVRGGNGGFGLPPLPADLLQATFSTSLADLLASAEYNDTTTALEHLAATVGLDGLLDWLGNVHVDVSFGVDDQGFYLRGLSGITLSIQPAAFDPLHPPLIGSANLGNISGWNLGGGVLGNLDLALRPARPEFRLRLTDLSAPAASYLVPTASGGLTLDITSTLPSFDFDWQGSYAFALNGLAVTSSLTASLDGHLSLPGLTLPGRSDPATIAFVGALDQGVWTLGLAPGSPNDFSLGGFDLNDVSAAIEIARDHFTGDFGATVAVALCSNRPPLPLAISTSFGTASLHITASAPLDDCYVGDPAVLWIDQEQAKLALDIDLGGQSLTTATLTLAPENAATGVAVVLPVAGAPSGQQPSGLATATGLSGSIDGDGNVRLGFAALYADLSNATTFDASAGSISAGPAAGAAPLVDVASARLRTQLINRPVELVIDDFRLAASGDVTFTHAGLRGDDLFDTFALGQIVKVKVNELSLFGLTDAGGAALPVRLDRFRLEVRGDVKFDALAFPLQTNIEPTLTIGDLELSQNDSRVVLNFVEDQGDFSVDLDGPVELALKGLSFDPLALDLGLDLGRFEQGKYVFAASCVGFAADIDLGAEVNGADPGGVLDSIGGQGQICFDQPQAGQTNVQFAVTFGFHFQVGSDQSAALRVAGGTATLAVGLTVGPDFDLVSNHVGLTATAQSVAVLVGEPARRLVQLQATDVALDFTDAAQPLLAIDGPNASLAVTFPGLVGTPLENLHGEARHFAIGKDFSLLPLPGFMATIGVDDLPSPQALGFPDWFPLRIDSVELQLGAEALVGDLTAVKLLISGGIAPVSDPNDPTNFIWPIEATVDRLPISVQKLAEGKPLAAIESPDGFTIGMAPFKIGDALEIGGKLSLHTVVDPTGCAAPVLYGQIDGTFQVAEIGGDISLIVSQYGPVLAHIGIPAALPLGPTGLIFTGADGGIAFGPARFPVVDVPDDVTDPAAVRDSVVKQLLHDQTTFAPIAFDQAAIEAALLKLARLNERCDVTQPAPGFLWNQGFTMALAGHFTTVASPGILTGDLNLAAEIARQADGHVSVKFLGSGVASAWGLDLGSVGALLDLSDPLAPQYDLAFEGPDPTSPLSFLSPVSAQYVAHLDTAGVVQAALLGAQTLVNRLLDGSLQIGLDTLAQQLSSDRSRPLARLLQLDPAHFDPQAAITADLLHTRLSGFFASSVADLARLDVASGAAVFSALLQEMFQAAGTLPLNQSEQFLAEFEALMGGATMDALQAAFDVFNPRLVISGLIQPTILGIPFGSSLVDADVSLDKRGLFVGFDASLHDMTGQLANLILPFGVGEFLFNLTTLGLSDRLHYDLKLPLGGVLTTLFASGDLPAIDPLGNWVGGFTGEIDWLGFSLAQVSGYLFAPHSEAEVRSRTFVFDDATTDFPDPVPPFDPATGEVTDTLKIPISSPARLDDLIQFGGLIGTSRFFLPALLTDPVGLLMAMHNAGAFNLPPGDPSQDLTTYLRGLIDSVTNVVNDLNASQEISRIQLYLPTPIGLSAEDWVQKAYLSGFADTKLLGMPLAHLAVDAGVEGIKLSADYPFLAGAHIDVTADFHDVNWNQAVEQLARSIGLSLDVTNTNTPTITTPVPRLRLQASLDDDRLADVLATRFGLPANVVFAAGDFDSAFQLFSPLYDFNNADPTLPEPERNGGVILDTRLSLLNLIENEQFHFEASLIGEDVIPDYTASADLTRGLAIPGLGFPAVQLVQHNLHALLQKQGLAVKLGVSGSLGLLGLVNYNVSGTLGLGASGLYGDITLGAASGDLANNLFDFSGQYSLQVNTTDQTQTTIDAPPRQIPPGPLFKIHLGGSADLLASIPAVDSFHLDGAFDTQIGEEGLSIDATGSLNLAIDLGSLLGLDLDPLELSGAVEAHLGIVDGRLGLAPDADLDGVATADFQRIEGTIGVAPGDDGFASGDFRLALSRWGCMQVELYNGAAERFEPLSVLGVPVGLPLLAAGCGEHVFVDNQRKGETNSDAARSIAVGLSRPAERDLKVEYTLAAGTAQKDIDWKDPGQGFLIIPAGSAAGAIPLTILGDQVDEDNETLLVTISDAFYVAVDDDHPDGQRLTGLLDPQVAPPSFGDHSARFTIVDDDLGPPPVSVVIEPPAGSASQILTDGTDTVLATTVAEGGAFSFTVRAENLDAQDSVQLAYRLCPRPESLTTASLGSDFFVSASGQGPSGVITLVGSAPQTIHVTTTADARYELDELFDIELTIVQPPRLSPDSQLNVNLARIAIDNDDFDRPSGALVFYDFDTLVGGDPYRYDTRPDYTDERLFATPFEHRDDQVNHALIFEHPGDQVTAPAGTPTTPLPTGSWSVDFWMNPGQIAAQGTILALGGSPTSLGEGLVIFLADGQIKYRLTNTSGQLFTGSLGSYSEGRWQHVALVDGPNPAGGGNVVTGYADGNLVSATPISGALDAAVAKLSLGAMPDGGSGYVGLLDEFHLWTKPLTAADVTQIATASVLGAESGLLIDYRFDEGLGGAVADQSNHGWTGRLGSLFDTLDPLFDPLGLVVGPTGRADWVVASDSPVGAQPRYRGVSAEELDGVPKIDPVLPGADPSSGIAASRWAALGAPFETAPYYHFMIGADAPRTGGLFDAGRMIGIHLDGVDFFERAAEAGPTRWELRSSLDGFGAVLASGQTSPGSDYQHHVELFPESIQLATPLHPAQPVEFRLYGLDASDGAWSIDNFALIAGTVSPATFNLPPRGAASAIFAEIGSPSVAFDPAAGAADPDDDAIAVASVAIPPGAGTLARAADGRFTFTPTISQAADVPLTFTLIDRWGASGTAVVIAHVLAGAQDDSFTMAEDAVLRANVLGNDQLIPGQTVAASLAGSAPPGLQFSLAADGSLVFRPQTDFSGTVSFVYAIAGPSVSDNARVTITVTPRPDPPQVNNDKYQVNAGSTLKIAAPGVLQNDSDPDGDKLTAVLAGTTASGTLQFFADGSFTYKPNAGFLGTDGFTYVAQDSTGHQTKGAALIAVVAANQPPIAANDSVSVAEDGSVTLPNLLANDRDPERGPLKIVSLGAPSHGKLSTSAVTGATTYLPAANFFGADSFVYVVADTKGLTDTATVTITVTAVNDPPIAKADGPFAVNAGATRTVNAPGILANDRDIEGSSLTAVLVAGPTKGRLTSFNANGSFTYVSGGAAGPDSFTYQARDASGLRGAVTTVSISVVVPPPTTPPPTSPPPVGGGGGSGGVVIPVLTIHSYVADSTVFFDADLDGVQDSAEPVATTDAAGNATLVIPNAFDTNGSGYIEPSEGVLVATGGIIAGTTQPSLLPLRATLGASVITPLTSLITALVLDQGVNIAAAQSRVIDSLGLPAVELLAFDPIAETSLGNRAAPAVLAAHKALGNSYVQMAEFLAGASRLPLPRIGLASMSALAAEIAPPGAPLDLGNSEQLARIVADAATRLGVVLDEQTIAAAAQIIAAGNQAITAIPLAAAPGYVTSLTQIESAAQGAVANVLAALGAGQLDPASAIEQTTGSALTQRIAAAPLGVIAPTGAGPTLANLYASPATEGGSTTLFGSLVGASSSDSLAALVNWGDGSVVQLALSNGAESFRFDHFYTDDRQPAFGTSTAPIGVVLLVNGQGVAAASVAVSVLNVAPVLEQLQSTPLIAAGEIAALGGSVSDLGLLDTHLLTVDWGDGQTSNQVLAAGSQEFSFQHLFAAAGQYATIVTATDDDGDSVTQTLVIDVIVPSPPAIERFFLGDSSRQRSMVASATVVFNQPVVWDAAAALLVRRHGETYTIVADNPSGDGRTYVLNFLGPNMTGGSLPNGRYELTIPAASVVNTLGDSLACDFAVSFHRLFGDADGDADIDARDVKAFHKSFKKQEFKPGYVWYFDHDRDGDVDKADLAAFNQASKSLGGRPPHAKALDSALPPAIVAKREKPAAKKAHPVSHARAGVVDRALAELAVEGSAFRVRNARRLSAAAVDRLLSSKTA